MMSTKTLLFATFACVVVQKGSQHLSTKALRWKEGPKLFKTHQGSNWHREAVDALVVLLRCTKDVGELQSAEHQAEKAKNCKMLLLVLQDIRFLARQGLPVSLERC